MEKPISLIAVNELDDCLISLPCFHAVVRAELHSELFQRSARSERDYLVFAKDQTGAEVLARLLARNWAASMDLFDDPVVRYGFDGVVECDYKENKSSVSVFKVSPTTREEFLKKTTREKATWFHPIAKGEKT